MLVSYQWLCELVDLEGISVQDIAERLNRTGIEVEYTELRDAGVSGVMIGEVLSTEKHPEADRLRICKVDVGGASPLQIICGAPNVAAGQKVPVAVVGAHLPDPANGSTFKIKKAKLRGIESFGMICSAKELGLREHYLTKDQVEGIFVLGKDATIGQDVSEYLGLTDEIIHLELTPNRSDCLGMIGVAYEIAAVFNRPLRLEVSTPLDIEASSTVHVNVEHEEDCPFYVGQVVAQLSGDETPQWMKNRLIASGIRPINNIVDVTNYVMLETGQPMHAFDYHKIEDGEVDVTRAQPGEKVVTLDGVTRVCDHETILIKNKSNVLAIAGIMGSKVAEVTADTTAVFLESAFFNPTLVRRASRKLGLRSEASSRFEKGVNPEQILPALGRATHLLQQVAKGKALSPVVGEKQTKIEDITIPLRHKRVNQLLGIHIDPDDIEDIFRRLHFKTNIEDDVHYVQVPTRRPDISIEVDLIEEVARLYGYDRLPTTLLWGQQTPGSLTLEQQQRRIIRHTLRNLGMSEVITYTLTSSLLEKKFNPTRSFSRVIAPLSKERSVLRSSLLPHLIEAASYNSHQDQKEISIFEMGRVFVPGDPGQPSLPEESMELVGVQTQSKEAHVWKGKQLENEFYSIKGILEALFTRLGFINVEFRKGTMDGFHPGRTAQIYVNELVVGVVGELHPNVTKQFDLPITAAFQLNLSKLQMGDEGLKYKAFSRYPAVSRDLAIIVERNISSGEIKTEIRKVGGAILESVSLFDVYEGEQVAEGKKSLAFSLVYRRNDRTLTEDEVSQVHQEIVSHLERTMDVKQRD